MTQAPHPSPERTELARGPASQLDWDRVYAEQLPRVYNYFRRLMQTQQEVEQHTARTFELGWRVRRYYRNDRVGFEARLLAIAYEIGAAAEQGAGLQRAVRVPSTAFAAALRGKLEADDLAERLHTRQRRLRLLAAGLLSVVLAVLLIPPVREGARRLTLAVAQASLLNPHEMRQAAQPSFIVPGLAAQYEAGSVGEVPHPRARLRDPARPPQQQVTVRPQAGAVEQATAQVPIQERVLFGKPPLLLSRPGAVRLGGSRLALLLLSPRMGVARGVTMAATLSNAAAFKPFCRGELDVVTTSRPIPSDEVAGCASAGIGFLELPVAYAGAVVLENYANTWAEPLSLATLRAVLTDGPSPPVRRWDGLSEYWPQAQVRVYAAHEGRGLLEFFDELFGDGGRIDLGSRLDAADVLAAVESDVHAIGIVPIGYYVQQQSRLPAGIKGARITDRFQNWVRPDAQSVASRYYAPLSRLLFLYVNAVSAQQPAVQSFITDVLQNGAELANTSVFLPLRPVEYQLALRKFQLLSTGTAFQGDYTDGLTAAEVLRGRPDPWPYLMRQL